MKKILILALAVCFFSVGGCATTNSGNPLQSVSENLDPYVKTLSADWLKASGFIRGYVGVENLPKKIVDQMDEIDSWFKDSEDIQLTTYQKWYIAGVRLGHTGPVLQAIIQRYAPGLLAIPEVTIGLGFVGLGL